MRTLSVNEVAEAIGLMAGVLTTLSFLPQVRQTWRTKSTKDISLPMFLSFCTGVLLWLVYGMMIHSLPVILANGVTFVLSGAILIMKLKWG
jgi:MtN3 and saliva related transmembrane protein